MLPWDYVRLYIFGRNATEMMLCSSHCILSGGTGFGFYFPIANDTHFDHFISVVSAKLSPL